MNNILRVLLLLALAAWIHATCFGAEPLDQWYWRNPLPHGNTPNAIAFGNGQFVAVGNGGAVAISSDGLHWTKHFLGPVLGPGVNYVLEALVYGGDRFVAVGFGSVPGRGHFGAILTSPDGVNWTPQSCPPDVGFLKAVAYGNGFYVAGGSGNMGGTLLHSTNGLDWAQYLTGSIEIEGVAFGEGIYVAVDRLRGFFCSSDPALGWEQKDVPTAVLFEDVTYGAGKFVAVGLAGTPVVSSNGCAWTDWPEPVNQFALWAISYGDGKFVGVGPDSSVAFSVDGSRWGQRRLGRQKDLSAVAYGNGTWVMLGNGMLFTSTNLSSFQDLSVKASTTVGFAAVAYGNGRFVAGTDMGQVLVSPDGVRWSVCGTGRPAGFSALTYGAGLFLAIDQEASFFISTDGIAWTNRASKLTSGHFARDLACGAGRFVLVGYYGTLLSSTNGVDWSGPDYTGTLYGVAYSDGRFVAVGAAGAVLTSPDGVDWTPQNSGTTNALYGIASGGGRFVAVGAGAILTSPDGATWTPARMPTPASLTRICYGNGTFTATGSAGAILTSTNGLDWIARGSGTTLSLTAVAYGQGTFVTVGDAGTILQSGQLPVTGLRLGPLAVEANGRVEFDVAGPTNQTWTIQASSELLDWTLLAELPGTNVTVRLVEPNSPDYKQRFYRGWAW